MLDALTQELSTARPALGLVSALVLLARFLPAFMRTKKLMPAGAVVAVGACSLATGA